MVAVALLESATGALIVPIFDQALQSTGRRTQTLFGLQRLIPDSGIGAWQTISILLLFQRITFCCLCDVRACRKWRIKLQW